VAPDPFRARRRTTREVRVGDVGIGGSNPLRVQSMTTTDTRDTPGTCDQIERLAEAGCEIVRVTAPSITDAQNLGEIRKELDRRRVRVPLVADIHFTPNAALEAAEHVEKVRINPGNYADKKKFAVREYDDDEYREELERVAARFRPLVRRCQELGRAMRIGTNHGSLSDRIMNRYGDTPLGMVESALEFVAVCEAEGFHDVVFSMKASNPQVAIHAYRLLAEHLAARSHADYPFHLGVTEAGDGEDGRIKSAIGIGALLEDGIGDTIRVSLTEDPVRELPVARALARRYEARWAEPAGPLPDPGAPYTDDPTAYARRSSRPLSLRHERLGGESPVLAELELGPPPEEATEAARRLEACLLLAGDLVCESLLVDVGDEAELARAARFAEAIQGLGITAPLSLRVPVSLASQAAKSTARLVVRVDEDSCPEELASAARHARDAGLPLEWCLPSSASLLPTLADRCLDVLQQVGALDCVLSLAGAPTVHASRWLAARLRQRGCDAPLLLRHRRRDRDDEAALLEAACDLGAPLCDGIGDAVALGGFGSPDRALAVLYRILQGARLRTSWTEFISCPSCGRTLFDLEETTARIKARTGHLRGVKIAIMGCVVNGPGEMADADFGYVGSGVGRVNLYVGKEVVARNLCEGDAEDRLVELIRERGLWVDR
jgi:(E)-4-hydroxy-3-methylbut-2-enyl-diphosphate synthase